MRTSARTIRRQVAVIQLRASGMTQAEVARELGIHLQSVARIERFFRRGWLRLPAGPLIDALTAEYHQSRSDRARAQLLASLVSVFAEESRARRAELELERVRASPPGHTVSDDPEPQPDRPARARRAVRPPPPAPPRQVPPLTPEGLALIERLFAQAASEAASK